MNDELKEKIADEAYNDMQEEKKLVCKCECEDIYQELRNL